VDGLPAGADRRVRHAPVTQDGRPRREIRITQRELREEAPCWGDFRLKRHLSRLVKLECVLAHRTCHRNRREYELLHNVEGRDGRRFLLGLIDPAELAPCRGLACFSLANGRLFATPKAKSLL